jgi:dihydroorotase
MNQKPLLIKGAAIVNEGNTFITDILIADGIIIQTGSISAKGNCEILNAKGLHLLPGIIDSHVHFREPGLTHKGDLYSESRAAIAGGVTSFIEMPNTVPNVLTQQIAADKFKLAAQYSFANYSFYMGINASNLEEVIKTDPANICAITDDGLYFSGENQLLSSNPDYMEKVFQECNMRIAIHSEDEEIIKLELRLAKKKYGNHIPVEWHPKIRTEEACLRSTKRALVIAKKYNTRLHVLHISTAKEAALFDNTFPLNKKRVTAEVCIHHLWFCDDDYKRFGSKIKWNPAIKTAADREALLQALIDDRIDIISTDHAPHLLEEKLHSYEKSPGGAPMVQHSLIAMLELVHNKKISLEKMVQKMSHNVTELFGIEKRGFIRKGYWADLVLVDLNAPWKVNKSNILYKCGWSPFEGMLFHSKVIKTIVNGHVVYNNGVLSDKRAGQPLKFSTA